MIKTLGHAGTHRRVAINVGAGFVPGTNAVVMGAAIAGGKLGWEMVGIRNGLKGCCTRIAIRWWDWLPSAPS